MRGETGIAHLTLSPFEFQSTPLMRGETCLVVVRTWLDKFQSTPLMRGETKQSGCTCDLHADFNPLPSCEGRPLNLDGGLLIINFNPLPSCEGRLRLLTARAPTSDFNPLPSCEGRPETTGISISGRMISIHSPHARGDAALGFDWTLFFISIHSPHARGDTRSNGNVWLQKISIHSPHVRGDRRTESSCRRCHNFNPLPSCEGRQA